MHTNFKFENPFIITEHEHIINYSQRSNFMKSSNPP